MLDPKQELKCRLSEEEVLLIPALPVWLENGAISAISINSGFGRMTNSASKKFWGSERCKFGQKKDGTCKRAGDRRPLKGGKEFLVQR